jgi:hypothetical protein
MPGPVRREQWARRLAVTIVLVAPLLASCGDSTSEPGLRKSGACASCHMPDFVAVRQPPHVGAKPITCGVCHTQDGWHRTVLRHEWPLTGAHLKTDCMKCHLRDPTEAEAPKACVGCHRALFDKPPFTAHLTFSIQCDECHTAVDWKHTKPQPKKAPPLGAPSRATPTATAAPTTAPKPKPKPTYTPKPAPTPTYTPQPVPTKTSSPKPDVTSGASPRR